MMDLFKNATDKMAGNKLAFNISITGDIGSGKSTVAKELAERLSMRIVDSGQLYRKFALDKNISVLEQNQSDDNSIDIKIDNTIAEMGKNENGIIFVSRLAWHFVPDSIKIYLKVNPLVAAERVVNDTRVGETHTNVEDTLKYNQERKQLELDRYRDMYSIDDPSGYSNADIICNIGYNKPEDVVDILYTAIINREFGFYTDPKVLLPTQCIRDFSISKMNFYIDLLEESKGVDADVSMYRDSLYINDGHHRVAACISLNKNFIRIPKPNVINVKPDIPTPYDYEDMVSIRISEEYKLHCSY